MGRIARFIDLRPNEQALLLKAVMLLAAIRLGLAVLPFSALRNILGRLAATSTQGDRGVECPAGAARERTVVWAVEAVGRRLPSIGTCLTQALAAYVLLGRAGCQANLRIGATRNAQGNFLAHAWLERDGIVLIGGTCHGSYTPMPALNGLEPRS